MSIASRINEMTEHLRNDWDGIDKLGLDITEENSNDNLDKNIENIAPVLGKFYNQVSDKTDLAKNGVVGRTSQDGTPTPENPVEINNLSGDVEYRVRGKNLANYDNNTNLENKYLSASGSFESAIYTYVNGTIKANSNKITISFNNSVGQGYVRIGEYKENGTFIKRNLVSTTPTTLTLDSNTSYLIYSIDKNSDNYFEKLQLELGTTATPYEPYISESFPLSLGDIELCNISDYKDQIYSQNGEFYLEKKTGKVVFDGSESGWLAEGQRYRLENIFYAKPMSSFDANTPLAYSDYFKWGNGEANNFVYGAFWYILSGRTLSFQKDKNPNATTLADFKTWLSTHNTVVYYVLATPTTTKITQENYPTLYSQLLAIQEFLTKYKINKEFLLDYSSPEIEY